MNDDDQSLLTTILGGAVFTFGGTVISKASGFAVKSMLAQWFGPDGYGALVLGYSVVTILLFFAEIGFPTALARYLPQTDDWGKRRSYIVTSLLGAFVLGSLLGTGFWLSADWIAVELFETPTLSGFIRVFAVAVPFLASTKVLSGVFRGITDARSQTLIQDVFRPLLRLSLTGIVVVAGLPLLWVANAWLAAFVVTALAGVLLLRSVEPRVIGPLSSVSHIEYVKFALPLMVVSAMGTLLGNTDTLLVGSLLGTKAVGIYDVAFAVGTLLIAVYSAFGFLFLPVFSELADGDETKRMRQIYTTVTKWMTILLAPVYLSLVVLAPTVLRVLFGEAFTTGSVALGVLLTGMYLRAATGLGGQALTAVGRPNAVMTGNVVGVVVNIALNLALIPRYGLVGAAFATAVVSASIDSAYLVYLNRRYGIGLAVKRTITPLLAGGAVAVPVLLWVRRLSSGPFLRMGLAGTLTTLMFLGAFLQFGLDDEDRRTYTALRDRR